MRTLIKNVQIIRHSKIEPSKSILVENDKIIDVMDDDKANRAPYDGVIDGQGLYCSKGFIETHMHGGGGADFMDDDLRKYHTISSTHARYGTTSILATTLAADLDELLEFLEEFENNSKHVTGAKFLGIHLEGPYFNMQQRGAQDPKYIRGADPIEYERILKYAPLIKRWSIAPEVEGAQALAKRLTSLGINCSIAHSNASSTQVLASVQDGFNVTTHLYSGMSSVTKINGVRTGGVVEATFLSDDIYAEVIADGRHLPLDMLKMIHKIKGTQKMMLTTDAMRAAGTDVSTSILGSLKNGQKVIIKDEVAKLPDETSLAGSIATTDRLIRTCLKAGISLGDAVAMLTETPARILHRFDDLGDFKIGASADLVLFNENIEIQLTMVDGQIVYQAS